MNDMLGHGQRPVAYGDGQQHFALGVHRSPDPMGRAIKALHGLGLADFAVLDRAEDDVQLVERYTTARALLREWGITATLVPLGTLPKIYAALRAQDIDAGMLTEEYHRAAQRALGLTAFPIPATGLPPVLATTRRLIRRHRGLVARVVQGYVEAIHLFKTNRSVVVPLLHRFLQHFDPETVEDIYAFYAPRFQPLPLPSAVVIQQMLSEFAATYPGAQTLPPTAVTDTSMLEELEQNGFVARLYGG
jgi:hypothetical protein